MREALGNIRSLVLKIGTTSLLDEKGALDVATILRHLRDLVALHRAGARPVLVSSGAIGAGCTAMGLRARPTTIPELQAAAAVGQTVLMNTYNSLLAQEGYVAAQLLLTHEDFRDRRRYLNMRNTLAALHDRPVLPVINENDTVSIEEIRFGDNDVLAALVAGLVDAELTVLLSDVDGFYLDGRRLERVDEITEAMEAAAGPGSGRGGMTSKLNAARMITRAGGHVVIAHGKRDGLAAILRGEPVGTFFAARGTLDSRARWVHGLTESGLLRVDAGGEEALRRNGKSLLAVGIVACEGDFEPGDVVRVEGPGGPVAKGLVNYGARDLRRILGKKTGQIAAILGAKEFDEVIHRDNLVLL
jgi:glutamate 5-kinase